MEDWKWLAYSVQVDGAYCKYCCLFATTVGHQSAVAGKLVRTPFRDWKDAKAEFKKHENTKYHQQCLEKTANFLATYSGDKPSIKVSIEKGLQTKIKSNRDRLTPIIKTAIFLSKLGLAFRGHKDSGPINLCEPIMKGEGNFRSLLKFRVEAGDEQLKRHLSTAALNATYYSWRTQNEIICAINEIILNRIIERVNNALFFSIMCDETTDIAGVVQLSFCVRFVEEAQIYEEFLQFIPVTDCTGAGLANSICKALHDMKLNCEKMVGQGYDGAGAMSGSLKGAQAIIQKKFQKAKYVHCASHSFNLSLSDGCSIQSIRNCMGIITSVWEFFRFPKRQNVLQQEIENYPEERMAKKLKRMCPTRWVERHHSVKSFVELLEPVVNALHCISAWNDKKTASDAEQLINSICKCDFLIGLFVVNSVFEISLPLSKYLQTENIDLRLALNSALNIKNTLKEIRQNIEAHFRTLFIAATELCEKWEVEIRKPRIVGRQIHRSNIPSETVEEYFRRGICIPFIDQTIQAIELKFEDHESVLRPFQHLCSPPEDLGNDVYTSEVLELALYYELPENIKGESLLWAQFLKGLPQTPSGALEALQVCNKNIFPTIHSLLIIMATLPVTTCSCERSFSSLKYLKNYLRSSTSEERLNGLALAYMHEEVDISVDAVLDIMAKKPRRLDIKL